MNCFGQYWKIFVNKTKKHQKKKNPSQLAADGYSLSCFAKKQRNLFFRQSCLLNIVKIEIVSFLLQSLKKNCLKKNQNVKLNFDQG